MLTAMVCKMTNKQPANVCTGGPIRRTTAAAQCLTQRRRSRDQSRVGMEDHLPIALLGLAD